VVSQLFQEKSFVKNAKEITFAILKEKSSRKPEKES
jgi:hypothetical protein